ncbi:Toll/interleukin-1 receptor domain-containing protein [Tanacetum coccineum]
MAIINEIQEEEEHQEESKTYDVFLSFRGRDTRLNFTDYLYEALVNENITTFLDEQEVETGEELKPELTRAIKGSRASIIVLSKNYASSTWCLDELVLILEQRKLSKHIVVPIFYHVEPTHVRKQESSFGEALFKHRQRMEAEKDEEKKRQAARKLESWTEALKEVADLKGKDVNGRRLSSQKLNNIRRIREHTSYMIDWTALLKKRTLVVLDGVDNFEQVHVLVGREGFHSGSRIIITTKDGSITDKALLYIKYPPKHTKLALNGLCSTDSLKLFCWHAFGGYSPKEGYEEDAIRVSKYCGGHPLALKVLGSSLLNEDADTWSRYYFKLLGHIACFFVGKETEVTEAVLKDCGVHPSYGIKKLTERCLLTTGLGRELKMHQLLQDMGRDMVYKESPHEPEVKSEIDSVVITIFGIFSTCFPGKEVPKWFAYRSNGSSISFTMPSSSANKRIEGINICYVLTYSGDSLISYISTEVNNTTKDRSWTYHGCMSARGYPDEDLVWLSHWMFGTIPLSF